MLASNVDDAAALDDDTVPLDDDVVAMDDVQFNFACFFGGGSDINVNKCLHIRL